MYQDNYNPLVTVIIPSYNHAQYIENAIESVKKQTYKNWELIVIDDGSSDNTHEVLKALPKDDRITIVLNKDNKRQSARLNQAINMSNGEYISLLASDDWYLAEKLEKQIELFKKLPEEYGVVYSGGYRYFEDLDKMIEVETNTKMKRGSILKELLLEPFFIYPITPLVKKECFIKYPFDEKYTAEGEAIYLKISMKYKFDFVDDLLVVMRAHSYNIGKNTEIMLKDNIDYRNELFKHNDFPTELKKYLNEINGTLYRMKGLEFIKIKNEYIKGRDALIKAIGSNKNYIFDFKIILGLLSTYLPKKVLNSIYNK